VGRGADVASGKPRLLILITLAEVGGAQTAIALLVPGLFDEFDVSVAAHGPGPLRAAVEAAGASYVPLAHVRRPLNPYVDLLGFLELMRLIRRLRPDVVHANSSKAGALGRLAARLSRVQACVFTAHGWAFQAQSGSWAAKAYLMIDRVLAHLGVTIVCVSESDRAIGLRAGTCRAERTVVLRNAVVISPQRELPGSPTPVVLTVARFQTPKDFGTLFRALAALDSGSFHAQVAGDGPDRAAVEQLRETLGLQAAVELLGTSDDVPALLADADIFVLSSRSEGLPLSILEAMARGLPVVATAVGGIVELVDDGVTGFLVEPGDVDGMAAAIRRLVADPSLRMELGEGGRSRVADEFSIGPWQRAHVDLYRRQLRRTAAA
jgi:glycosyltransferase involved in cell wall biosynthesis